MSKPFTAEMFMADAYGATPDDKAKIANGLVRLVEGDFRPSLFTKDIYDRLNVNLYGHIAEFNRHGFYDVWMSTPARRADWLRYVARGGAYGLKPLHRTDTWADVEHAFAAWVIESGYAERAQGIADWEVEKAERAELSRLMAKYAR